MAEPEAKQTTVKIVWPELTDDDKPSYANGIMVNHTPWDFTIFFSQVVLPPAPAGGTMEVKGKRVATITFPVTLVRGLIDALQTNLDLYEEQYGKIEIPKGRRESGGNGQA
jgi:hypothetical protein